MSIEIGKYRHFKGKDYEVIAIAKHTETLEKYVVYKALYGDYEIWIRPLEMFIEEVVSEGKKQPRFKKID